MTATAPPMEVGQARLLFLRPRDRDDGGGGAPAYIAVDDAQAGKLKYGGFFWVDLPAGPATLSASGRYLSLGSCALKIDAMPAETIYLDVGPRTSYMVATGIGSLLGIAAASTSVAVIAAADTAGAAAGAAVANAGETCSGPYKLNRIDEADALPRLDDLAWSQ